MSISLMQFSCGDYSLEGEKSRNEALTDADENEGASVKSGMDLPKEEEEEELEFGPLEHPMEPPDEDRPVQCPMPHTSIINVDGRVRGRRIGENWRKRGDKAKESENKEGKGYELGLDETAEAAAAAAAVAARGVRKRHHNLIRGEQIVTPFPTMPPFPSSLPPHDFTIFPVFNHFDKF